VCLLDDCFLEWSSVCMYLCIRWFCWVSSAILSATNRLLPLKILSLRFRLISRDAWKGGTLTYLCGQHDDRSGFD
jgi:hypothetical protein